MKNYKQSWMRLIIMYEHFSSGNLHENYGLYYELWNNDEQIIVHNKMQSYYDTYPFVFTELTYLFSEWEKIQNGIILYHPIPKLEYHEGLKHFLNLSEKQYNKLFVPTREFDALYGYSFSVNGRSKQIAENIRIFLDSEHW